MIGFKKSDAVRIFGYNELVSGETVASGISARVVRDGVCEITTDESLKHMTPGEVLIVTYTGKVKIMASAAVFEQYHCMPLGNDSEDTLDLLPDYNDETEYTLG